VVNESSMRLSMVGLVEPRSRARRRMDTESRLNADTALWLATGSQHGGTPQLLPVPFLWYDSTVVLCEGASTLTARNLETTGYVRLALGDPLDVVIVDGAAEVLHPVPEDVAAAYVRKLSRDPCAESDPQLWFVIRPQRILAWRSTEEEADRTIFRDGEWL
jgi:hypothetical protein